jgi:acyl-coenzyme A thioesterase PaaI-like protein
MSTIPGAGRWTHGVRPLPQTVRAAERLRRITDLVLSLEVPEPELDALLDVLDQTEGALGRRAPVDPSPRVGGAADGDGRAYVDHSRDIGSFNPCFPEYGIAVDGERAEGTVNFPICYEGPAGYVHGGFLALFFDAAVQHHHCDLGVAGRTASLTMRYRRPTPLRTDLRFTLTRTADERWLRTEGRLLLGDELLCVAQVDAVKGDRARLPAVSPRRWPR